MAEKAFKEAADICKVTSKNLDRLLELHIEKEKAANASGAGTPLTATAGEGSRHDPWQPSGPTLLKPSPQPKVRLEDGRTAPARPSCHMLRVLRVFIDAALGMLRVVHVALRAGVHGGVVFLARRAVIRGVCHPVPVLVPLHAVGRCSGAGLPAVDVAAGRGLR